MDTASVHFNRSLKQTKPKKKPIKVVYISSPMKVKTSVAKFRSVVQGLTGRDSDPTHIEKFLGINGVDEPQRVPDQEIEGEDDKSDYARLVPGTVDHEGESSSVSADSSIEPFDDVFTAEMIENFTGLPARSSLFFEPQGDLFRSLDVVL
ncbi:hypothetical protein MRB53_001664 [Persea americana]|uniref:Uncharacterized protein n=1 Tax=Persea americana TaxID=3435 RepID=A0ACC2MSC6_PERAE|nr:hypothetical protein MRB53_001664 [Persea americana]